MKGAKNRNIKDWLQGSGLAQQLFRGGAGNLLARVAEVILSLAVAVLLAQLLGASGYGIYAFVLALASIAAMPAQAGLPSLIVRETARGQQAFDWPAIRGIWRWSNGAALLFSLLTSTVAVAGLWLGWGRGEALWETIVWALGLVPLLALIAIRLACLRGLRHVLAGVLPELVLRPALLAAALLVIQIATNATISPGDAMALTFSATLIVFVITTLLLRRYCSPEISDARPIYRHREWMKAAWPMALTQGFEKLNRYADLLLLGLLAATVDVGIYRVAAQGALLASFGLSALNMVIAPYAARLNAEQAHHKLQVLVYRTAQISLAFAIPTTLLFSIFGESLLVTLFGDDFRNAYLPLLVLAAGQVVNAWFGPTGQLLTMTGYERDVTRSAAIAAGLNITLNILLIPKYGALGAAFATSISLAAWNVWLWRVAWLRLKIRCSAI
ncbi:flippase [Marinobacter nauticus]|uniref:O-antigen/teichoic acid export membrane protein n=1 Tax=Marinobacter nauticus TaxID=2743 RepID=A0A368UXQ1_MARNT|nr:flippase [Marinobacter nauticus]RBP72685.1 O-antigen/teichoic acid export membrane protein [Marinobacter nauticus]RCW33612.1 O-antigen/teichoic acid export membrane protein [Marinobacter nauticus]